MSTVRTNTIENLNVTITHQITDSNISRGYSILWNKQNSKWMNSTAIDDYLTAIQSQLPILKRELASYPDTRRAVMHGPQGACWVATQVIAVDVGVYNATATYRSMDQDHLETDVALQSYIAAIMLGGVGKLNTLTLNIASFHKYL